MSAKVLLIFLVVIALTQAKCRGDGIDLCQVTKAIKQLQLNVAIGDLEAKLGSIVGGVVNTLLCDVVAGIIPVKVCLPTCSVVQSLLDLDVEISVIDDIVIGITGKAPECPNLI